MKGGFILNKVFTIEDGQTTTPAQLEEVRAAAKSAKIDGYIESLPDGYDTLLSDDGVNISK